MNRGLKSLDSRVKKRGFEECVTNTIFLHKGKKGDPIDLTESKLELSEEKKNIEI
jgi:hypothetical protein